MLNDTNTHTHNVYVWNNIFESLKFTLYAREAKTIRWWMTCNGNMSFDVRNVNLYCVSGYIFCAQFIHNLALLRLLECDREILRIFFFLCPFFVAVCEMWYRHIGAKNIRNGNYLRIWHYFDLKRKKIKINAICNFIFLYHGFLVHHQHPLQIPLN